MKEKPLLFKGPMVRALLDGTKTQTRRIIKPQPPFGCVYAINGAYTHAICSAENNPSTWVPPTPKSKDHRLPCPHPVGSRIWVKETWAAWNTTDDFGPLAEEVSGTVEDMVSDGITQGHITYRADKYRHANRWRPSLFMPRWASRILLEVTEVRVERLQEISEGDAQAEGCQRPILAEGPHFGTMAGIEMRGHPMTGEYRDAYKILWEQINGKGSWDQNPWVWAYTFRRVTPV